MEKIFRNCSRWIKLFAKIGFAVYAVYATYLFIVDCRYSFFEGFIEFNLNVFKGFALLFVMYGFAKIVEHFEKKDTAAAPAPAEKPAPEAKAESAVASAPAEKSAPEAKAEPAPAPAPAPAPTSVKTVKYCPKCGSESDAGAHFCDRCGTAL